MATPRKPTSPPGDLDKRAKRLWSTTLEALDAAGTWRDSDSAALERYVRAWERALLAREARKGELTTTGSQGQLVSHPNLKTEREAERDAREYANDLLLTPAARKRAGLEAGDPDDGPFGGSFS